MLLPLLHLGDRWTFVGGKGGVGKTTAAAALAVSLADAGEHVLVLSVDPAHSLGDALGTPLSGEPAPVPGLPGLEAMEVDPDAERARFLESRRGRLLALIERGTYLDAADAGEVADLAVPGLDELAALFRLMELARDPSRRLVIDTAPTGHTLRLLDLAEVARGWVAALRAMDEKHAIVASALTRDRVPPVEADALVTELEEDLTALAARLRDAAATRFLLVTNPEPVVLAETQRYRDALEARGIALAGILVNRSGSRVPESARGAGMVFVPRLTGRLTGPAGLRRFAAAASAEPEPRPASAAAAEAAGGVTVGARVLPPRDRILYLVGGKGGVGKTTAAAAMACDLAAHRDGPVLLLSIDPAGSLAEVLGTPVGAEPVAVPGAAGLHARQLDAEAVWDEFRDEYREQARRLFDRVLSGGLSAGADQAVVERLIDLAPPGIDEVVALLEVIDLTEDRPYDAVIVDTAPTGHLLRLLEMPELALEWTHALLRLLLKYREVLGLGGLAERVLALSRSIKTFRARLGDERHTWMMIVALPESLSVPETKRLAERLRGLDVPASAVLVNRALADGGVRAATREATAEIVRAAGALPVFGAPDLTVGPVGPDALRDYLNGWRQLEG